MGMWAYIYVGICKVSQNPQSYARTTRQKKHLKCCEMAEHRWKCCDVGYTFETVIT